MLVKARGGFFGLLATWLLSGVALFVSAKMVPGVEIATFRVALISAVVLGLLNALVRPLLTLLTLPITLLTLGLFLLVVNGLMVGAAAWLVDGFHVRGLFAGILMAIVVTLVSGLLSWLLGPERRAARSGG
jgi:putative membrane protein